MKKIASITLSVCLMLAMPVAFAHTGIDCVNHSMSDDHHKMAMADMTDSNKGHQMNDDQMDHGDVMDLTDCQCGCLCNGVTPANISAGISLVINPALTQYPLFTINHSPHRVPDTASPPPRINT
jgi:hypothetical protein